MHAAAATRAALRPPAAALAARPAPAAHPRAPWHRRHALAQPGQQRDAAAMSAASSEARRKGAILGSLVADAATMGLHWIYQADKMAELMKGRPQPEFYKPPSCPFYQMPSGSLSPYGAETAAMLAYLDARRGAGASVEGASWSAALAKYFEDTYSGYRNKSIKTLIANLEAGKAYPDCGDATDTQANMLCKVPVVVARFAGSPELPAAVEASVRAQQASGDAAAYGLAAARLLERVVLGDSIKQAVTWASAAEEVPASARPLIAAAAAAAAGPEPLPAVAQSLGVSCAMPGALQVALAAALRADSYEAGVRANILALGDNASRACYLGALLGAAYGGPPAAWLGKVSGGGEFEAAAGRVATDGAGAQ